MSLGVSELTDDQLFELLQEMCVELTQRDPVVQRCCQASICDHAQKLEAVRAEFPKVLADLKKEYLQKLREEFNAFVREDFKEGRFKLFGADEESQQIPEAERQARRDLVEEVRKTSCKSAPFNLNITNTQVVYTIGSRSMAMKHKLTVNEANKLIALFDSWDTF